MINTILCIGNGWKWVTDCSVWSIVTENILLFTLTIVIFNICIRCISTFSNERFIWTFLWSYQEMKLSRSGLNREKVGGWPSSLLVSYISLSFISSSIEVCWYKYLSSAIHIILLFPKTKLFLDFRFLHNYSYVLVC